MSEQKRSNYMRQLDGWTDEIVITPLWDVAAHLQDTEALDPDEQVRLVSEDVKKAIREKVLESYRNGQKAGPARRPYRKQT